MTRAFSEINFIDVWSRVDARDDDGCWTWTGAKDARSGFGSYTITTSEGRRNYKPHRLVAEMLGFDIAHRYLRHSCGNRLCCNPKHLLCKVLGRQWGPLRLAANPPAKYNRSQRNEFSLSADGDPFLAQLLPLRVGKPAILLMDVPVPAVRKMLKPPQAKRVAIHPFSTHGAPRHTLLVSIIGSGCCLVNPCDIRTSVANLVLAKMPAKLANTLMEKLHRVLQE